VGGGDEHARRQPERDAGVSQGYRTASAPRAACDVMRPSSSAPRWARRRVVRNAAKFLRSLQATEHSAGLGIAVRSAAAMDPDRALSLGAAPWYGALALARLLLPLFHSRPGVAGVEQVPNPRNPASRPLPRAALCNLL